MSETFTCPKCGMTSYNPNDAKYLYCENCHEFVGQMLTLANVDAPVLEIKHSEQELVDNSEYRFKCPICKLGVFLVKRNQETLKLEEYDRCMLCAQQVRYVDIEDMRAKEPF